MKKAIKIAAFLVLALGLCVTMACAGQDKETIQTHKIGVVVYDLKDEQVQAFREYLETYIAANFADVDFLYSSEVNSKEEEMQFLQDAIDAGVEGILAFNTYDLEAEVQLCADNGVYFIRPSGTIAPEDLEKVAYNPYFLGFFGPGNEMEYEAGFHMASYFTEEKMGDSYFIVSGGASSNVMHEKRTEGILDALQQSYGVTFEKSSAELAVTEEPVHLEAGDLKVCIFPGYIGMPQVGEQAKAEFASDPADIVLGAIPLQKIAASLGDAKLGIIDCYTEQNGELFKNGSLKYLCGKYESIIGPAFAALYNAMTGYAEDFRDEDGKAFAIQQGFWTSTDYEDFEEKYELSSGITLNAYSYEDLLGVCKAHNPSATLDELKALAGAWDFDSALQRRK